MRVEIIEMLSLIDSQTALSYFINGDRVVLLKHLKLGHGANIGVKVRSKNRA